MAPGPNAAIRSVAPAAQPEPRRGGRARGQAARAALKVKFTQCHDPAESARLTASATPTL